MIQLRQESEVPVGHWSEVRVVVRGNRFEVFLNGQPLFVVKDDTFITAGKVGLWTKADSVTSFDNLQVKASD